MKRLWKQLPSKEGMHCDFWQCRKCGKIITSVLVKYPTINCPDCMENTAECVELVGKLDVSKQPPP